MFQGWGGIAAVIGRTVQQFGARLFLKPKLSSEYTHHPLKKMASLDARDDKYLGKQRTGVNT